MIETSIPEQKAERAARVCTECGASGPYLQPARSAKSWAEARSLPMYCPRCNPRRRNSGAAVAMLERMGG